LKARAAAHHRSPEEEVRIFLRSDLARPDTEPQDEDLVALALRLFGAANVIDLALPPRDRALGRPTPDFAANI